MFVVFILLIPIILIGCMVGFLAAGITDLVYGFRVINGKRNKTRIIRGFIFLGIIYLVVAAFIVLIFYLSLVPIRFM